MKEREALAYVKQAGSRGIVPGLESVRELCRRLGNPQAGLKIVHVAGTNGKGSVSAYIASVLKCGGYRVGRYISPAIFDYREIIQTDEHPITKKAFCQGMELIREACEAMEADGLGHPTAFEMETALGFWYFQEKKCDIVVLETGMGGLLDATNLAEGTLAAVITSVSRDHMKFLGDTLGEIAAQKAGIIKAGCHVVTGFQEQEVLDKLYMGEETAHICPMCGMVWKSSVLTMGTGREWRSPWQGNIRWKMLRWLWRLWMCWRKEDFRWRKKRSVRACCRPGGREDSRWWAGGRILLWTELTMRMPPGGWSSP